MLTSVHETLACKEERRGQEMNRGYGLNFDTADPCHPSQSVLKKFRRGLTLFTLDWVQKCSQAPDESPFPSVWEACSHDQPQPTERWPWACAVHTQDVCSCLLLSGLGHSQRQGAVRGSVGIDGKGLLQQGGHCSPPCT